MTPGMVINLCGGALFCVAALGTVSDGHWWAALAGLLVTGGVLIHQHFSRKKEPRHDA